MLILLTAAVNYMNFSLAETPMRLRSINTQKVLGASTFSLRMYLLLESVLVCVCGFLLSLLWLYLLQDTSLNTLVAADLSLMNHPNLLIALGGMAVCMGLLAGAYPSYYVTSFPPVHEARVFITPGFIFGTNGKRYIRISLCAKDEKMKEALERIKNVFEK